MTALVVSLAVVMAAVVAEQARHSRARARGWHLRATSPVVASSVLPRLPVGRRSGTRRVQAALARGMPEALEELARALRSGATVSQGLAEVAGAGGPAGQALAALGRRAAAGGGVAAEAARWGGGHVAPEVRAAAVAVALAASGAAHPARGVEAVAAGLRQVQSLAAEARGHSAQARLSATVLGVLPVAFTAWVVAVQPGAAAFLLGTPTGLGCLAAGATLELVGVRWMAAILREPA